MASCLYLFDKHPIHQHPPVNVKNKQAIKKSVEHVVVNWSFHLVLFLVQGNYNFITAIRSNKTNKQIMLRKI